MITLAPDPTLSPTGVRRALARLRSEVALRPKWHLHEEYVDRGARDPHYWIEFKDAVGDAGDDVRDEPLYRALGGALSAKNLTAMLPGQPRVYWSELGAAELVRRLVCFERMYDEDYLQPPGVVGESREHPRFRGRRFVFQITAPSRTLVGIGPSSCADGAETRGALRGRLTDDFGAALPGREVELVVRDRVLARKTDENGAFWFSAVPSGPLRLRVAGAEARATATYEGFGSVRGVAFDPVPAPAVGAEVQLTAPDGEVVRIGTDSSGGFRSAPIPAFPYQLGVEQRSIDVRSRPGAGTALSGVVRGENGLPLAGVLVVLRKGSAEVARLETTGDGLFRFDELNPGEHRIVLQDQEIRAAPLPSARVVGNVRGCQAGTEVELVANGAVVARAQTGPLGEFALEGLVPGAYSLRCAGLTFVHSPAEVPAT